MISEAMSEALNEQMNHELYSAHLYLALASRSGYLGFKGAHNWFFVQYQEEMVHFMKFYTFINSRGLCVKLSDLPAPPTDFDSLLVMFEQTLEHEEFISARVNHLADLAVREKDHATAAFIQWFVTEQVEEEETDREVLAKLRLVGDNGYGLLMLDKELAARVFVPPTPAA